MHHTINENAIAAMVETFYGTVRDDQMLGPIFASVIGDEWTPHLEKMKAFWSSVLLASRSYKGNPMITHLRLPRLTEAHFERWLKLWRETAASLCANELAELFNQRAETIGARLLYAISQYQDSAA